MLRSSSTPILGSLLSSFAESPNHQPDLQNPTPKQTPIHQTCSKLSCTNAVSHLSRPTMPSPSRSVCEISASTNEGFRRVQSDGNLEELANAFGIDEFGLSQPTKKSARKPNCCTLEAIPSFSVHGLGETRYEDDEYSDGEEDEDFETGMFGNSSPFKMVLKAETRQLDQYACDAWMVEGERKMYLATGLGASDMSFLDDGGACWGGGNGSGGNCRPVDFDKDGGDSHGIGLEEHYKKMMLENPGNPLFLRNYANFLYQTNGDLRGAEEYYSRAILADPGDGEILSQYAKLVWELHHDRDRAASYFERAVQASSEDSHIQAAYASFLWETEDEEEEDNENKPNSQYVPPFVHQGVLASATA